MNRRQRIPRPPSDAQQTTRHGGTVDKQTSPRTLKTYKSALKKYREWCTSNNIRPEPSDFIQVNDYLTHLYDAGYAPNTIVVASAAIVNEWRQWKLCALIQRHIRQIVDDTLANGYVPQQAPPFTWNDLVALYQLELRPRKKGRGMESEEVARSRALRFFSQIAIMLTCGGVRIAEAGAIEWHDIIPDEDGWGLLLLPKTKANPRATKRKIIPVVMDIFNQYAGTVPMERRTPGHQTARHFLHPNTLTRKLQEHRSLLGKWVSSHSCRRGSAYILEDLQISTSEMQKLMGWKQASMVPFYTVGRIKNPIVDAIPADFDIDTLSVPTQSKERISGLQ